MGNFTVFDIANALLTFESMPHKKLQKLCYYAYAWYLTFYNEHLFPGPFEAWIHGPVHSDLYHSYKGYGRRFIEQIPMSSMNLDTDTFEFLKQVYSSYGELSGDQLEAVTHDEEPWKEARWGLSEYEPSRNLINDHTIIRFYREVSERAQTE